MNTPDTEAHRRPAPRALAALAVVMLLAAACGSGGGSSSATGPVVATGSVTCTGLTGSVSFTPPLTSSATTAGQTAVNATATGCTTKGSNVSTIQSAALNGTISTATSACTGLLTSKPLTLYVTWDPPSVARSMLRFSGYTVGSSSGGGGGLVLPGSGNSAHVTGSFAGSDHGAESTANAYSSQGATQLLAACASPGGLANILVTSGKLTLK
jgi:hypothetical protein